MKALKKTKLGLFAIAWVISGIANADPIVITPIGGSDDGGSVGGYSMTDIDDQENASEVTCINSEGVEGTVSTDGESGNICFTGQGTAVSDIEIVEDQDWWQYPDQGDVFVTNQTWIEILLPPNTRAVSLWVGASFTGVAWIGAQNDQGDYLQTSNFYVGPGNTQGFGVYSSDSCSAITKIIVDPTDWGFGNLSINQDPCVSVPEPGLLALLLAGFMGMAITRRYGHTA